MEVKARAAEAAAGAEGQQETPAATVVTAVLNSTHIVPPPTCGRSPTVGDSKHTHEGQSCAFTKHSCHKQLAWTPD